MRVGEFLFGRRVDLALPLPPEACAARLKTLVPKHEWPIGRNRLMGRIEGDQVSIRYRGYLTERRYYAELDGQLVTDGDGARLIGSFRSLATLFAVVLMHAALVVFAVVTIRHALALDWMLAGQLGFYAVFGLMIWTYVFDSSAMAEDDWLRIHHAIVAVCAE